MLDCAKSHFVCVQFFDRLLQNAARCLWRKRPGQAGCKEWGGGGLRQRECDSILEAHKQTRQVDTKVKQEQGQREGQGECKEPSGNLAKRNAI